MTDIVLTSDNRVCHAEAITREAEEFIDSYTALELVVVDAGRVIIPLEGVWAFRQRAQEAGLVVSE